MPLCNQHFDCKRCMEGVDGAIAATKASTRSAARSQVLREIANDEGAPEAARNWAKDALGWARRLTPAEREAAAKGVPTEKAIRAVNSHDALVEALKAVIRVADRRTDEFEQARAALALATEETR